MRSWASKNWDTTIQWTECWEMTWACFLIVSSLSFIKAHTHTKISVFEWLLHTLCFTCINSINILFLTEIWVSGDTVLINDFARVNWCQLSIGICTINYFYYIVFFFLPFCAISILFYLWFPRLILYIHATPYQRISLPHSSPWFTCRAILLKFPAQIACLL